MKLKITKIILIVLVLLVTVVEGLYLFVLPYIANKEISSEKINKIVNQKTGLFINYQNTKIITYPDFSIRLKAKYIELKDNQNNIVFSTENLDTKVWLPSFIFKKLTLQTLETDNFFTIISREKNKKFYLGNFELNINPNKTFETNADLDKIKIKNANITIDDKLISKKLNTQIHSFDFYYKQKKFISLNINADIFINDKKKTEVYTKLSSKLPLDKGLKIKDCIIEGHIKNFDLSDYSTYIAYFTGQDILSTTGVINTEFKNTNNLNISTSLKDLYIKMKNPYESIISKEEIILFSDINFASQKLIINSADIKSKNWQIKINGSIKNYLSQNFKDIKPDLDISVLDSNINDLYWLAPPIKNDPQQVIQKFKKYGAWGIANGDLQLKGTANMPDIYGDLTLSDVYIVKDNPLVPHCKINTQFFKNNVKVTTRVFAGHGEYVDIDGTAEIKIYGKGDFKVKSSSNVDLNTAEYMLVPIHEIVGFDLGPVPYMDIKGKGNIDIRTKGTVKDGEVFGKFNFKQTTASLQGLNTVLHDANGSLIFNGKDMHFYTTNAKIKNKSLKIDGKANLDGKIDFEISSLSMNFEELLKILNTSSILKTRKAMAEPVEKITGNTKVFIKLKGIVKDFSTIEENETLSIIGKFDFTNTCGKLKLAPQALQKMKGFINFDDNGWNTDFYGYLGTSKITIKGYTKNDKTDIKFYGNNLKTDDLIISLLQNKKFKNISSIPKTNSVITFDGEYKSNSGLKDGKINLNNIKANGRFVPIYTKQSSSPVNIKSGNFSIANGKFIIKNFNTKFFNSNVYADLVAEKIFSEKPILTGKLKINNFDVSALNLLKKAEYLPNTIKKLLLAYENYQGIANIDIKCNNNNFDGYIDLKDIHFNHSYFKTPIYLNSGKILLKDSRISMKAMVAQVDSTPVFLDFSVWDLDKKMKFKGYLTTKITEYFVNKYINSFLTYPIKPKGDITLITNIQGNADIFNIQPKIVLAKDADIYYRGANLSDEDEQRELWANIDINQNIYHIKKMNYVRYMTSQNNKSYPITIFTGNGLIEYSSKKKQPFYIHNLNVDTPNNANAKIFNVIFKKSVLKNGMFNCKLNIKGFITAPQIRGKVFLNNIDMPIYDTLIKNATILFKDKTIEINTDGITYNSDFNLKAVIKNKFTTPYIVENLYIHSEKINLDTFINSLTKIPTPDTATKMTGTSTNTNIPLNISDIQIKKGVMNVKNMIIRGLPTNNYSSEFKLEKNMVLDIEKLWFDVTTGKVTGSASYNFSNERIKANLSALNVDSNKIASTLFEFKDQIFGQANGSIVVTTSGNTEEERLKNMHGYVYFEIADGKMPKLGSVEYLLKAGNFIKSGITGISLNNFISLIAPIKTGHFDSIKGNFALKNGIAQNIEVYSKGENLNIYINGEYDILQQFANLRVYGRLTKNATNILGKVGNLSFNSLLNSIPGFKIDKHDETSLLKDLNKIPGVELSDQKYRIFTVKVDGHINEEKFVKNFRWIE